jgi:hypothetical protein
MPQIGFGRSLLGFGRPQLCPKKEKEKDKKKKVAVFPSHCSYVYWQSNFTKPARESELNNDLAIIQLTQSIVPRINSNQINQLNYACLWRPDTELEQWTRVNVIGWGAHVRPRLDDGTVVEGPYQPSWMRNASPSGILRVGERYVNLEHARAGKYLAQKTANT